MGRIAIGCSGKESTSRWIPMEGPGSAKGETRKIPGTEGLGQGACVKTAPVGTSRDRGAGARRLCQNYTRGSMPFSTHSKPSLFTASCLRIALLFALPSDFVTTTSQCLHRSSLKPLSASTSSPGSSISLRFRRNMLMSGHLQAGQGRLIHHKSPV
jgi:hypothetical protein